MLPWGLVPFWSKTPKTKYLLNNARAEGIERNPSFREPIKQRRCIIPVSGFFEWLREGGRISHIANKLMLEIHDRMPVILDKDDLATWLKADTEQGRVLSMLKPLLIRRSSAP